LTNNSKTDIIQKVLIARQGKGVFTENEGRVLSLESELKNKVKDNSSSDNSPNGQ